MGNTKAYVIGLDYGTDSVRSLLVDALTGAELALSVFEYPRWKKGLYCAPERNQFRQHPLDYIEGLEYVICDVLNQVPEARESLKAIALDTTGSTPCLVDKAGTPLALSERYADNPDAMFILWKDHTAMQEAQEINALCANWEIDYRAYSGRDYSSEWFWAKALHALRADENIRNDAYSIVEHCDWIPALLTGVERAEEIMLSRCSAGHKALWAESWGGFPSQQFLSALSPLFDGFAKRLNEETYTCDHSAGNLCRAWADRLGLSTDVRIGIGNTDAHAGAVGAGVRHKTLVQNIGTSICNMAVMPCEKVQDNQIEGISGQVDGSIVPGMIGFEAGMSAFGDVYAWFKNMLIEPANALIMQSQLIDPPTKKRLIQEITDKMIGQLTEKAEKIELQTDSLQATDWLNGRRNPYINDKLKGSIMGLSLATDAAAIYRALVEATAFGVKAIIDHFLTNGIEIEEIIATGGIPQKSPFVMQVLSDVLSMPIRVSDSKQACALGSVMFAATVSGIYPDLEAAQAALMKTANTIYYPDKQQTALHAQRYVKYKALS